MEPKWLEWAKRLQSISQAGLEYSKDPFDRERFEQVRQISIEIMNSYTGLDNRKLQEIFANETGYQTPKIDVRAAIFNNKNEILLVKEKNDNRWSLPGGWADIGLSVRENIIKEAREEAGVEVEPKRVIAVQDRQKHTDDLYPYSVYKIFIECDFIRGEFVENIETSACNFYNEKSLPRLSTPRITAEQLVMCFKARQENIFEAFFD